MDKAAKKEKPKSVAPPPKDPFPYLRIKRKTGPIQLPGPRADVALRAYSGGEQGMLSAKDGIPDADAGEAKRFFRLLRQAADAGTRTDEQSSGAAHESQPEAGREMEAQVESQGAGKGTGEQGRTGLCNALNFRARVRQVVARERVR